MSKTTGADGLGEFAAASGGSNSKSNGEGMAGEGLPMDALMQASTLTGMATLVSEAEFQRTLAAIFRIFGVTGKEDKVAVQATLVTFFSVHGTSPETQWSSYGHMMVARGKEVPPFSIVQVIGQDNIKRFMGRYSEDAVRLYKASGEFRRKLQERVARANLTENDGYLAIDFVGKDGKMDQATMAKRAMVRQYAVTRRNADRGTAQDAAARAHSQSLAPTMAASAGADPFSM